MNPNDDQSTRWLAYMLGDLPPDEATEVEAEMRDDPARAEELKRFFEATTDWAKRPVAAAPVDLVALTAQARGATDIRVGRTRSRGAWPWAAAAAAILLLVVLSQASISVQFGDTTLAWGTQQQVDAVTQLENEISALNASYTELAEDNLRLYDGFEQFLIGLNELEAQVQIATTELARNQERESHTRYTDMQRMLEMMQRPRAVLPRREMPTAIPASFNTQP